MKGTRRVFTTQSVDRPNECTVEIENVRTNGLVESRVYRPSPGLLAWVMRLRQTVGARSLRAGVSGGHHLTVAYFPPHPTRVER